MLLEAYLCLSEEREKGCSCLSWREREMFYSLQKKTLCSILGEVIDSAGEEEWAAHCLFCDACFIWEGIWALCSEQYMKAQSRLWYVSKKMWESLENIESWKWLNGWRKPTVWNVKYMMLKCNAIFGEERSNHRYLDDVEEVCESEEAWSDLSNLSESSPSLWRENERNCYTIWSCDRNILADKSPEKWREKISEEI